MRAVRVIFAGGGTGGHLFPAIAIADELKKIEPNAEILFIGTKDKIEARVVPEQGYSFRSIWISGFHRRLRISNVLFPLKVIVSFMQSLSIIKSFKPDVVVGTGGYVSGPILRAAIFSNISTLIQEQNSYPGVTTRMLAQKASEVHVTFESSKKYFKRTDNIIVSGNPTRNNLEHASREDALKYFGFNPSEQKKTLLVFGGSLGALTINNAIQKNLGNIQQKNIRLIWQTGIEDFESEREFCAQYPHNAVWVNAFIDRMDYAYAASDLVICRAGATTIAELTRLGKPSILVPYPFAAANHQVENAKSMVEYGAAEMMYDQNVSDKLDPMLSLLQDDERLKQMSAKCKLLGKPHAARDIALRVIQLAGSR